MIIFLTNLKLVSKQGDKKQKKTHENPCAKMQKEPQNLEFSKFF